jgi:hypothetical protein
MTQKNGSDRKNIEMITHRIGSEGAPSRRTAFIRGTNTKQWEVPKITRRNTKANICSNNNNNNNNNNELEL